MSDQVQQINNYYIIAFIFSLLGGLILLFSTFGWWYNYYYSSGVREWGYVYFRFDQPLSVLIIGGTVLCMLFGTYVSFLGFRGSLESIKNDYVTYALITLAVAFAIVVVGAIVFVISVIGSDEWGLDWGFYGGFIGSGVSLLMFYLIRMKK